MLFQEIIECKKQHYLHKYEKYYVLRDLIFDTKSLTRKLVLFLISYIAEANYELFTAEGFQYLNVNDMPRSIRAKQIAREELNGILGRRRSGPGRNVSISLGIRVYARIKEWFFCN